MDEARKVLYDKLCVKHDNLRKYIINVKSSDELIQRLAVYQIKMAQLQWRLWGSPFEMSKAAVRRAKHLKTIL